jgi:FHS family L-fucose permease-like MFS transporter
LSPEVAGAPRHRVPLIILTTLFFMWGLITSLNDILIPHLRNAFALSYVQAMLIQFCFFGAYFVMSLPSGWLVEKVGYQRGIVVGLIVAAAGCLLFHPAAAARSYPFFLAALFILASGITLLQVAANPYVTILGRPETASVRLTLTQAFNSLGTTVGPLLGSALILGAVRPTGTAEEVATAEAATVQGPYLGLAAVLLLLGALIALSRLPRIRGASALGEGADASSAGEGVLPQRRSVWQYPHLVLGVIAIFVYVGGEVAIGSLLVNFMGQPEIAGLDEQTAGNYLALYWGGAMVGRFIGAGVMTRVAPGRVLGCNALIAAALLLFAIVFAGRAAMWALLAIGLFNSIMFPTIFALALEGLGRHTSRGSGLLCMAIVGGALVPLVQGAIADSAGLLISFLVPLACYLYIAYYGLAGHRPALRREDHRVGRQVR